jgi:hypothetical protein
MCHICGTPATAVAIKKEDLVKMAKDTFASRVDALQKARAELHRAYQKGDATAMKRAGEKANKAQEAYLEKIKSEKERIARLEEF